MSAPIRCRFSLLLAVVLWQGYDAGPGFAQSPPAAGQAADVAVLSQAVTQQRRATKLEGQALVDIDRVLEESRQFLTAGNGSEGRRRLAQAATLLAGKEWDAKQEFLWSLTLRSDRIIADSLLPVRCKVEQVYGARAPAEWSPLRLRLKIAPAPALPNIQPVSNVAAPAPANAGAPPKDLGQLPVFSADLLAQPVLFQSAVASLPAGPYRLQAELVAGEDSQVLGTLESPVVQYAPGVESMQSSIESRLAKISGHEGTAASIRYPFDVARVVNSGLRNWDSFDFPAPYDFAAGLIRSEELLKELEAGRDPLTRAKGDVKRHYWFTEAGEISPWRMQVPTKWDGTSPLPMVLVLHGNTKDQDYYLDRDGGILRNLAEQYGFLVVTPFGYYPNGGWRAPEPGEVQRGGGGPRGRGPGSGPVSGLRSGADPRRARFGALSEQDALNVLEIVRKEYPIDSSRMYLFGHSSGGAGTYHIAQKYAEKWTAVAVSSGNVNSRTYPFERIAGMPFMIVHGSLDNEVRPEQSRNFSAALKERNMPHEFIEYPEATHASIVPTALPKVFEFFKSQQRPRSQP